MTSQRGGRCWKCEVFCGLKSQRVVVIALMEVVVVLLVTLLLVVVVVVVAAYEALAVL